MVFFKTLLRKCAVLAFWLSLWQVLALLVRRALLLPGPAVVLKRLAELAGTAAFWRVTAASLLRIVCGIALAVVLAVLLSALCCRFRAADALLSPLFTVVRATPVASFIILLLIWIGRETVPVVIVLLIVLPVVWGNVCAGIRAVDPLLLRTARVFGFSPARTLRRAYVPAVLPYFLSGVRSAIGLGWKSGIAAEVLTVPSPSIGKMLFDSKLYLETVDLFAWTLVVVVCSLLIEKLLLAFLARLRAPGGGEGEEVR